MGYSRTHRYSAISKHSLVRDIASYTRGLRTSSSQVSHASLFQLQARERAQRIAGTCGLKRLSVYGKYDLDTVSWRTCQTFWLRDISQQYLRTYTRHGMMSNGVLWELTMLEPPIVEREFGLWPTPQTLGKNKRNTGTMQDWRCSRKWREKAIVREYLHPEWVEWLMGWPIKWTSLKPLPLENVRILFWDKNQDGTEDIPMFSTTIKGDVEHRDEHRKDRIHALGNGWVPLTAAVAWILLMGEVEK